MSEERLFKGIIVEESLEDNRMLNEISIVKFKISSEDNPSSRWHLYTVRVSLEEIQKLSSLIKDKWYMHFWRNEEIIIIFKNKIFECNIVNRDSLTPAIEYGLSLGIPKEQLDFPIKD